MRKFCLAVLTALMSSPTVCQVNQVYTATVQKECPVEGLRVTPRVYAYRLYTAGVEGWRPDSKMALDLRLKNSGDRAIAAMSFEIKAPRLPHKSNSDDVLMARFDNVVLNLTPGDERQLSFPANGRDLIDLAFYPTKGWVSVVVTQLRYGNGEIVDLAACNLGDAPIPPPFKPVTPPSPTQIYPVGGEVSRPRVLESHAMPEQNGWQGGPTVMTLSFVVEVDGTPQDIKVESGSRGPELDEQVIKTLRTWNFAPAMMGDKPVATRIKVQFKLGG